MKKKLIWIAVGQIISAIAYCQILNANNLVATGIGGMATVINRLTGANVQMLLIAMAMPIFLWAFFRYNKTQIFYAAFSYFMFTFYVGIVDKVIPQLHTDPIAAAVSGGVVGGIAGGIIMKQRVANGPESIVALYLKEKKGISIGTYYLVLNTVVICSSIIYGDLTMIIYSLICTFVQSLVTDKLIIGFEKYYNVNIMSDQYLEITQFIRNELNRGATFIQGMDTTNVKKKMLIQAVVNQQELIAIREYVKAFQDDSFICASRSNSIIGRGFDVD
ncbi:YitT family protein [Clostridium sp. E02]|uniref:YitT family protein n=1 Tax=Clostridium sp. E02 TaxID=2487134 RepID=UPI0013DE56D4|nr:YitT family protein [Clostridium sp. E02]